MEPPPASTVEPAVGKLEAYHLGVYRVLLEANPSLKDIFTVQYFDEVKSAWLKSSKLCKRLVRDVVALDPWLVRALIGVKIWENTQDVFFLALETRILQVLLSFLGQQLISRKLLARLNMDLPTTQDNMSQEHVSSGLPWQAFEALLELCTRVIAAIGQLIFILNIARSGNHGLMFAFLCLVRPVFSLFFKDNIWSRARVVEATNESYLRMRALQGLADKKYRHDVISSNIVQYIINEFRKARAGLGNVSIDYPENQYRYLKNSFTFETLADVAGDLPLIYYAILTIIKPAHTTLTSIASLQQSTTLLRHCFYNVFWEYEDLLRHLSDLQQLYDVQSAATAVRDGDIPYPNPNGKQSCKGMAFELRNVSFSYPGNQSDKRALDDVSFKINPGDIVVIVGSNGSGKSTFINLLTRMYDASAGKILVDGEDIRHLKLADFRQATAILTQEHNLFPLSIAENIGLGLPDAIGNKNMILEAARLGGADKIIQKLDSGLDTVLEPMTVQYSALVREGDNSVLSVEKKKLKKSSNVSGGERQRLVAARTFMRFNSNRIKFVAVDEPSSALDPEGELELFNNLREARDGKTMLFVTHRFGPISKWADQILCMKDGKVVESGRHPELMLKKGEYFKMYNIQAKAFEPDSMVA
ncbi:hypothetical protein VNI00_005115 [Paramarasmius palmivorus]|uniref:ABC transporter domain-containing protein n=1 Tax=Paramarasmius palmivorus TaxID=297713 RepID=A0AAW0DIK3_9AGAR